MNILNRYEKFRGNLAWSVPEHFCCAIDGGKLVVKSSNPDKIKIECVNDFRHEGMVTPAEYAEAHPTLANLARDEVKELIRSVPEVKKAIVSRGRGLLWEDR